MDSWYDTSVGEDVKVWYTVGYTMGVYVQKVHYKVQYDVEQKIVNA